MKFPALKPGDKISFIAPSSPVPAEARRQAEAFCRTNGFHSDFGPHSFEAFFDLAGTDEQRLADLYHAFEGDNQAVFALRGGYGTHRLLDKIDWGRLKRTTKPLFGFSDTTGLQLAFQSKLGQSSISGFLAGMDPNPESGKLPDLMQNDWEMLITGQNLDHQLNVIKPGQTNGILTGGCLSLISSLCGTDYLPDFSGKILFIEEVAEAPYRLDRMMQQLALTGQLQKLNGLILGDFYKCERDRADEFTIDQLIQQWADFISGPVLSGLSYGHTKDRRLMPMGTQAIIDTNQTTNFSCESIYSIA